jgi:hypothetical protein
MRSLRHWWGRIPNEELAVLGQLNAISVRIGKAHPLVDPIRRQPLQKLQQPRLARVLTTTPLSQGTHAPSDLPIRQSKIEYGLYRQKDQVVHTNSQP